MSFKFIASSNLATKRKADSGQLIELSVPSKDYLFTQNSIVSSVQLERNSHLITPETAQFVNANGDAWSNEALQANYQSFIGAFNFVNHVQIPEQSVGFIADAALRRRYLDPEQNLFVYYVDILVATHRDHAELVRKITLNEIEYLSMGCSAFYTMCSRCGYEPDPEDEDDVCEHLAGGKGRYYFDSRGIRRVTAELLGKAGDPNSVLFEEASWLTQPPAFGGAAKRNLLNVPQDCDIMIQVPEATLQREAMKMYFPKG